MCNNMAFVSTIVSRCLHVALAGEGRTADTSAYAVCSFFWQSRGLLARVCSSLNEFIMGSKRDHHGPYMPVALRTGLHDSSHDRLQTSVALCTVHMTRVGLGRIEIDYLTTFCIFTRPGRAVRLLSREMVSVPHLSCFHPV